MKLGKLIDEYLKFLEVEVSASKHTLRGYGYDLKIFLKFMKNPYIRQLETPDIRSRDDHYR